MKLESSEQYAEADLEALDNYFRDFQKMLDELNGTNG